MKIRIKPIFAWYDLWVGFFWDKSRGYLYFFPVPMLGIILKFGEYDWNLWKHIETIWVEDDAGDYPKSLWRNGRGKEEWR